MMKNNSILLMGLCAIGVLFTAVKSQAGVVLDLRPELGDAANPGDGSTRINITAGTFDFPIDPTEVATPLIEKLDGKSALAQGGQWGGTGLNVGGTAVTFIVTELVDYDGLTNNGAIFRVDANGLGMGIDSSSSSEQWFVLDGQESFTWTANTAVPWEGFTLRSFGTSANRALTIGSTNWVGLSGVTPGTGVTFDDMAGIFTVSNISGNVANDGLTLEELVGVGGPSLDFTSITFANTGSAGTAIQTLSFGLDASEPPIPELNAFPDSYTLDLDVASTLTVSAPGVLTNDVYTETDSFFALLVDDFTSNGTLNLSTNGSFTYEPDQDFVGTNSFTYKAFSAAVTSEVVTVQLMVIKPVVPPPVGLLPFVEPFDILTVGALDGQNDWEVQGSVWVQTNEVQNGSKATELINASASHELLSSNSTSWVTFWAYCEGASDEVPAVTDDNASVVFYVNTNQNLVVYNNTVPVVLSTVISSNVWTRFDVYCDYDTMTWDLSVNKTNIAAGLSLYSTNRNLKSVLIQNASDASVYVDSLSVVDQEPVADPIDGDGDGMPDWWERKYFGGITNAAATNLNAYIAGLQPGESFELTGWPLSWEGQPGRRYSLFASTNLLSGFTLVQSNMLWNAEQPLDLVNTNETAEFYRISVELDL